MQIFRKNFGTVCGGLAQIVKCPDFPKFKGRSHCLGNSRGVSSAIVSRNQAKTRRAIAQILPKSKTDSSNQATIVGLAGVG
ncbi:MAG: hypothetical protein ACI86S_000770, partial [Paracoccaceae bacterium]